VRSASITYMIRHYVARRAAGEDHPHNAADRVSALKRHVHECRIPAGRRGPLFDRRRDGVEDQGEWRDRGHGGSDTKLVKMRQVKLRGQWAMPQRGLALPRAGYPQ